MTFDSGGISLKPSENMEQMKADMTGGAEVLGAVRAAAQLRLRVNVVGILPATENMPGGRATKPGGYPAHAQRQDRGGAKHRCRRTPDFGRWAGLCRPVQPKNVSSISPR